MDKKALTERDICTKFITPAIQQAGWDINTQIREEVTITLGRVIVRGKLHSRGKSKRADYVLFHKPNIPLAVLEAKDNNHGLGDGMQQALAYSEMLDVPFAISSNGDGFLLHDRTGTGPQTELELALNAFPSPENLWQRYSAWKGLDPPAAEIFTQDYHTDKNELVPYWLFSCEGGACIIRHIPALPLSRDLERLDDLHRSLAVYRMVFGQPRQEDLLHFLRSRIRDEGDLRELTMHRIDLSPS